MSEPELSLYEEVLLLALDDDTGRTPPGLPYTSAMAGAILAELTFRSRVTVNEAGGRAVVQCADPSGVGDPLLDDALARIVATDPPEELSVWIRRLLADRGLKTRASLRLVERGILREEEGTLLFFTRKGYPAADPEPERRVVERLRAAIFTDAEEVDARTRVLLSLARSAGLLRRVFGRAGVETRARQIDSLLSGAGVSSAVREVLETADGTVAAILGAVTLAAAGR